MSTSYMIIEKVRRAISSAYVTASDTEVSKALGVSRTAVSSYKHGRDVMSMETLDRAQALMQLDRAELAEIAVTLAAEQSPQARASHAALRYMLEIAKNSGLAILAAVLLLTTLAPSKAYATARDALRADDLYIMRSARRRARKWERFSRMLEVAGSWIRDVARSIGRTPTPIPSR